VLSTQFHLFRLCESHCSQIIIIIITIIIIIIINIIKVTVKSQIEMVTSSMST